MTSIIKLSQYHSSIECHKKEKDKCVKESYNVKVESKDYIMIYIAYPKEDKNEDDNGNEDDEDKNIGKMIIPNRKEFTNYKYTIDILNKQHQWDHPNCEC